MSETPEVKNDFVQSVIQRLYENEALTSALTDDAATILLKWGEEELANLAQFNPSQSQIDDIVWPAARVLRSINHITERRADLSESEMVEHLLRLVKRAMELGVQEFMIERGISHDQET